jgi:hypothetical protein
MERSSVWHEESPRLVAVSVKWTPDITYDLAKLGKIKPLKTPNEKPVWKKLRE